MPLILAEPLAAERFYVLNRKSNENQTWDDLIDYRHVRDSDAGA
jgi:hypothetical protein